MSGFESAQELYEKGVRLGLERDFESIEQDVRDGKISLESAREDYKVVIDPESFKIDSEATEKLRH